MAVRGLVKRMPRRRPRVRLVVRECVWPGVCVRRAALPVTVGVLLDLPCQGAVRAEHRPTDDHIVTVLPSRLSLGLGYLGTSVYRTGGAQCRFMDHWNHNRLPSRCWRRLFLRHPAPGFLRTLFRTVDRHPNLSHPLPYQQDVALTRLHVPIPFVMARNGSDGEPLLAHPGSRGSPHFERNNGLCTTA